MKEEAGQMQTATFTLTRKAALRRGVVKAGAGGQVQEDQALAWHQGQQPALSSRPHTRAGVHLDRNRLPAFALHASVGNAASRPATRNFSSTVHACRAAMLTSHSALTAKSGPAGSRGTSDRRSKSTTPGEFRPKYEGELERTIEVQGWGGQTRTRVFVPDDGGSPEYVKTRNRGLFATSQSNDPNLSINCSANADQWAGSQSPLGVRAAATGYVARTPRTAKAAYMTNRNPSIRDHHELSQCLVTDWVFQTIPAAERTWTSAHLINSDNAAEWSAQEVIKSQAVKQDFFVKVPQYAKHVDDSPQVSRFVNVFPFRGAGRLDGRPHITKEPAGLVPNDVEGDGDRGIHAHKRKDVRVPHVATHYKQNVHIRPYRPPASSGQGPPQAHLSLL